MSRLPLLAASMIALAAVGAGAVQANTQSQATATAEVADINTLFEQYDEARLGLSPQSKAYRGIRDEAYGEWDEVSDEADEREYLLLQRTAQKMQERYDPADLSAQDALSYRLFNALAERSAMLYPYREYGFLFDHRRGAHTSIPAFLINIHRISEPAHAEAYVERIQGIGPQMDALIAEAQERADAGVMPPDWV